MANCWEWRVFELSQSGCTLIKVSWSDWIVHLSLIEIVNRVQLNPGYIVPRRHFANWMRLRVICIGLVPIAIVLPPADQPTLCLLWWANTNTQSTLWPRKWASFCHNCSTHGIANDVCQLSDMSAFVCILLLWWRPLDIISRKGWNYYIMTIAIDVTWPWIRILSEAEEDNYVTDWIIQCESTKNGTINKFWSNIPLRNPGF